MNSFIYNGDYESRLESIEKIKEMILKNLEMRGFSDDQMFDIEISLEEALYNAIVHGNGINSKKTVNVSINIDNELFQITITDQGDGFNVQELTTMDCTRKDRILRGNGRGLFIIRKTMDSVEYSESGRCITMIKRKSEQC